MKIISNLILATLLFTACGGASSNDAFSASGAEQKLSPPGALETAAARAEVKIMHNGKVLASYLAASPDAALDKEYQTIGLNLSGSDTAKQMLMIVVEEQKAGVYPLDGSWDGKDKLSVMFINGVLPTPSLAFDKGELNITELTDKHCSGTFKGTGTAGSEKGYSVEAVFSKLPVVSSARDSRK
ncbi:MAG: hypothetical protein AVDCRST_MAG74-1873 [uncultured Pyrinomonadaceae bacterium]|uniref:Lipoprotein n=1 Tax=uncultured Pyrinomonadaceae bacterium TaxID=2283094 RepID=A0A6J4P7X0_9BACT|nr:MAG: hypothetical protein AVDCRST_MAG74-1873 [uncultured Pyrinomonadaceae bacterium]